jgi:dihydrofolate reductase
VVEEIAQLKAQDGPLLQVHVSSGLIQTLLAHNLIDEFRLWTFPVVLGNGKRLFGTGSAPEKLRLIKSQTTAGGVVMGIYRNSG